MAKRLFPSPARRRAAGAFRRRSLLAAAAGLTMAAATAATATAATAAPAGPVAASVTVTSHFMWTADSANTIGDTAYIDNGATNGEPGDILFVTPNFNANGLCGCQNEFIPAGVYYDSGAAEWAVFLETVEGMPAGESFNVLVVPKSSPAVFVDRARSADTKGDYTLINSRLSNGKPDALIQVTQDWNPGGRADGVYNPHPVGVEYIRAKKEWAILNEDRRAMPLGASFNVLIGQSPSNGGQSVLVTNKASKNGAALLFSNRETSGNPNNVTFITQDFNPGGTRKGTYNGTQPSAWYDGAQEAVWNTGGADVPLHAAFNLLIFSS
jgi:hypothetical protein